MKVCSKCKTRKPTTDFYPDKRARDHLRSRCKPCVIADTSAYHKAHPEMAWRSNKQWRANNPDKVSATKRRYALKKKYGLTPEQFDVMLEQQRGRCAICGTDDAAGAWGQFHVDHDHATGRVRGLLCYPCNLNLGLVESRLEQMVAYVRAAA